MSLFVTTGRPDIGTVLEGERLLLRYPQAGDYEAWAELRRNSQDFLTPWEPSWAPDELSRIAFRRRLRRYQREIREDRAYPFFIFERRGGALAGGCTLSNVRRGVSQTCSLGYWIGESFSRQGYMAEAVRALIPFVFETLRLHRIEAACLADNIASRKLLAKLGFREEGTARRYLRINGSWRDHVLYATLEDDPRS